MRSQLILTLFIFLVTPFFWCQKELNGADTINKHSPKKAVIFSSILPGSGQVYNHLAMVKGKRKVFWKVPLIYFGLTATTTFLIQNQQYQKDLKADYTNRITGGNPDPRWEQFDDQGILTLYDQYLTRRDLSILGVATVYLLQVIDAGIEAHFVHFDISEDLSVNCSPTIMSNYVPGLKVHLNFNY